MKRITEDVLAAYILKHGKAGAPGIIKWLVENEDFVDAISSPMGQEIMNIHVDAADEAFVRYHEALSTNKDIKTLNIETVLAHAEYQVCLKIIKKVQAVIKTYKKRVV